MGRKVVSYLRVSTDRQGRSGLGLDGQREAVEAYCRRNGASIMREYVEVESGRHDDRPKLAEALAFARRTKATLLVAKLDRLSRSVRFIATVLDSGVEFSAADVPEANRLLLHILAAVAEAEARAISERTKSALKAARARGILLGTHNSRVPHLSTSARLRGAKLGAETCRRKAAEAYADIIPTVADLRSQGLSLRAIATYLNHQGYRTRLDRPWSLVQVRRVLKLSHHIDGRCP